MSPDRIGRNTPVVYSWLCACMHACTRVHAYVYVCASSPNLSSCVFHDFLLVKELQRHLELCEMSQAPCPVCQKHVRRYSFICLFFLNVIKISPPPPAENSFNKIARVPFGNVDKNPLPTLWYWDSLVASQSTLKKKCRCSEGKAYEAWTTAQHSPACIRNCHLNRTLRIRLHAQSPPTDFAYQKVSAAHAPAMQFFHGPGIRKVCVQNSISNDSEMHLCQVDLSSVCTWPTLPERILINLASSHEH